MSGETVLSLVGNLVDAPELRFTASGQAVASFTVASTPRVLDKASGEWRDGDPLFMRCSLWRQPAENLCADDSIGRGTRVLVMGRLRQRSFETREGEKRTVVELEVDEVGPSLRYATARVNKTSRGGSETGGNRQPAYSGGGSSDPWANTATADESEIPF